MRLSLYFVLIKIDFGPI